MICIDAMHNKNVTTRQTGHPFGIQSRTISVPSSKRTICFNSEIFPKKNTNTAGSPTQGVEILWIRTSQLDRLDCLLASDHEQYQCLLQNERLAPSQSNWAFFKWKLLAGGNFSPKKIRVPVLPLLFEWPAGGVLMHAFITLVSTAPSPAAHTIKS